MIKNTSEVPPGFIGSRRVTTLNNTRGRHMGMVVMSLVVIRVGNVYHQLDSHFVVTCCHYNNLVNLKHEGSSSIVVTFQFFL